MLQELGAAAGEEHDGVAAVNAILAAESVVDALALVAVGKTGLQAAVDTAKKLESQDAAASASTVRDFFVLLLKTAPVLARAESTLAAARMDTAFSGEAEHGGALVTSERLASVAKGYASAAAAGRAYFQALVGLTDESASTFAFAEPSWATASMGTTLAGAFADKGTDIERTIALAAGAKAYLSSAALQNKYYALEYRDGVIGRRAALTAQMDEARSSALSAAATLKASTGIMPSRVIIEFNQGEELREGSDDDKIHALSAYWRATFAASVYAELTRATSPKAMPPSTTPPTPANAVGG
jgi:hypothetical protein